MYIAAHWPEKVAKVVLVASTPFFAEQNDWPGIKPNVLNTFKEQLVSHREKTIERFLAIQAMGSESARDDISIKNFIKSVSSTTRAGFKRRFRNFAA